MESSIVKMLEPVPLPSTVSATPDYVVKMIKCGCDCCSTAWCNCRAAHVSCSEFSGCLQSGDCKTPQTVRITYVSHEDEETNELEEDGN